MTEQKHSACPFCGGEVDPTGWLRGDGVRGPECDGCGATARSMEAWESRAETQALREEVAALRSDANSYQSGYDEGRRMAAKHRQSEVEQLTRDVEALRARVVVPDGYALVPVEPTVAMRMPWKNMRGHSWYSKYRCMLEAAPRLNGKAVSEGLLLGLVQVIEKYTHDARVPNEVSQELATELILAKRALLGEGKEHE